MLPFLCFIFQPWSSLSLSSSSSSDLPSSSDQPISVVLHQLTRAFVFCRDNTVVAFLFFLLLSTILWLFGFSFLLSRQNIVGSLKALGVSSLRARRCMVELKRKSFHLLGLLIPIIYYIGLKYTVWLDQRRASLILGSLTLFVLSVEVLRMASPAFHRLYTWTFASMMRKTERDEVRLQLTGSGFFFAGHFLAVFLFDPTIATCASLYLVLGDMTAAIFGISFGRVRLPWGKSIEGAFAMWLVCLFIGTVAYWHVPLAEYPVFVGASVATVAELMLPRWLDDNITIPVTSGVALHLAFRRIGQAPPVP